jgi:hypothetical protein
LRRVAPAWWWIGQGSNLAPAVAQEAVSAARQRPTREKIRRRSERGGVCFFRLKRAARAGARRGTADDARRSYGRACSDTLAPTQDPAPSDTVATAPTSRKVANRWRRDARPSYRGFSAISDNRAPSTQRRIVPLTKERRWELRSAAGSQPWQARFQPVEPVRRRSARQSSGGPIALRARALNCDGATYSAEISVAICRLSLFVDRQFPTKAHSEQRERYRGRLNTCSPTLFPAHFPSLPVSTDRFECQLSSVL